MIFQRFLAVITGKLILSLIKFLGRGGGFAAPGYYALKLCPNFLSTTHHLLPITIVVTGTNGKTTTARMISHFAQANKLKVIRNHTGSNLERGIASQLIQSFSLWELIFARSQKYDLAVWELDEAAFNQIIPKIKVDQIVFLNIYRDQLDRYGEIDSVVKNWSKTLDNLNPGCKLIINGDDANLDQLAKYSSGEILYFGIKGDKIEGELTLRTPKAKKLNYQAQDIKTDGLKSTTFNLTINSQLLTLNLPLPGLYHVYDLLAASAVIDKLSLPLIDLNQHLANFSPAFGRVEEIKLPGDKSGFIFLIKNPTGATQVLETIKDQIEPQDHLLLALNDNFADGTDVSWIWDTQWEQLSSSLRAKRSNLTSKPVILGSETTPESSSKTEIFISGTRAHDLALRLKYAGFDPDNFIIKPDLKLAFIEAKKDLNGKLFILPTYTALLELQQILKDSKIKQAYWKES